MALISRNGKGRGNAGVSGSGEVETGRLCSGKRLFFISSTARGLYSGKRLCGTRAGRKRKFNGRSACGVSRGFHCFRAREGGRTGFSRDTGICPPRLGGRLGRRTALISRNGKGRGNAIVSGSGEVETGRLCSGKRLFFISSTARGLFHKTRLDSTRAGRKAEESLCRASEPGKMT